MLWWMPHVLKWISHLKNDKKNAIKFKGIPLAEYIERSNKAKHHLSPLFSLRNPHGDLTVDPKGFLLIILSTDFENSSSCWSSEHNDWSPSLRNTRGDLIVNPSGRLSDLVVDPGLLVHRAPEPCARDPYQRPPSIPMSAFLNEGANEDVPPALVVDDERSPGVAQAGVVLPGLVPGAEHLGVELGKGCQGQSLQLQVSFMLRTAASVISALRVMRSAWAWRRVASTWFVKLNVAAIASLEVNATAVWYSLSRQVCQCGGSS